MSMHSEMVNADHAPDGLSATKRKLFALLLRKRGIRKAMPEVIQRRKSSGPCLLSFAQERLWTFEQIEPDTAAYNIPVAVRLKGRLSTAALEQSINQILRRHEALRVTFTALEGKPVQVVSPFAPQSLRLLDLSELPSGDREREALRLTTDESRRPFNLTRDLLLRSLLVRMSADEHILLLVLHHIAADGWSLLVLTRELATLYEALAAGQFSTLPELPIQYTDYAHWQRGRLQAETLDAQLSYWKRQLAGAPQTVQLPTDRARPSSQTFRGAKQTRFCSKPLTQALRELSRQQGTTLFMTLLAAYSTLLYRYSWQEEILIGTPIANRTRLETEGLIGFFVNTLVVRADLSGNPTFEELLGRVREVTLSAYAHQDMPFEKLVNALQVERDASRHPLFQAFFVFFDSPLRAIELSNLTLIPAETYNGLSKFDIELAIIEDAEELRLNLLYNVDLFDAQTISRFLDHFESLLKEIVARPHLRLPDIALTEQNVPGSSPRDFHSADLFTF
jgi:hypothetical protein